MTEVPPIEHLEPDGYLQPRRFRIWAQCNRCGHRYSWITKRLSDPDKPCPKAACQEAARDAEIERRAENLAKIILENRAPGRIGENQQVKNIDKAAQVVMEDYGLTDLKDNVREGDTVAPSLPTVGASGMKMNDVADTLWGGRALAKEGMGRQAALLGQMAIAGSFRSMSTNPAQIARAPKGAAPLTMVKTEPI